MQATLSSIIVLILDCQDGKLGQIFEEKVGIVQMLHCHHLSLRLKIHNFRPIDSESTSTSLVHVFDVSELLAKEILIKI
jgi:hypothetical protein